MDIIMTKWRGFWQIRHKFVISYATFYGVIITVGYGVFSVR